MGVRIPQPLPNKEKKEDIKMSKIIIEDRKIIEELEALQYEVQSRQALLSYMINTNIHHNESFDRYEKEYFEKFKAYEYKKSELENKYIKPMAAEEVRAWNLIFNSGEVYINE